VERDGKGHVDALIEYASYWLYGRGVEKNCGHVIELLRTAANVGSVDAMCRLGYYYEGGVCCVEEDLKESFRWYSELRNERINMRWRKLENI